MLFLLGGGPVLAHPMLPSERTFSFTVFSAEPVSNLAYKPNADAAPLPLVFYPTARSPRYEYCGPETVCFVDVTTGMVTAEAHVPVEIRMALLIFSPVTPAAPGAMRYTVRVIDDSVLGHAPGGLVVQNFSGLPLDGTINRRHIVLAPGSTTAIQVGSVVTVQLRTLFRGRSYQAYAETIQLDESGRALLFLLPPFHRGSLEVQSRLLLDSPVAVAPPLQR